MSGRYRRTCYVFHKLEVSSRTMAVLYALRRGWVVLDERGIERAGREGILGAGDVCRVLVLEHHFDGAVASDPHELVRDDQRHPAVAVRIESEAIGKAFNKKHASVIYSIATMERKVRDDPRIGRQIEFLTEKVRGG